MFGSTALGGNSALFLTQETGYLWQHFSGYSLHTSPIKSASKYEEKTYPKRLKERKAELDQPDAAWEALADGNTNITLSLEECRSPSTPCMDALKTIYSNYPKCSSHSALRRWRVCIRDLHLCFIMLSVWSVRCHYHSQGLSSKWKVTRE